MSGNCKHCRYFVPLAGTGTHPENYHPGACRKNAPRGVGIAGETSWPQVQRHDWCGEFLIARDNELERRHEWEKEHGVNA